MREACFACTTPYQVIGAISITIEKKLDADLFVFGMFPNYVNVCKNIRNQGIFQNVFAVDCSKLGHPGKKKAFLQMLFSKQVVSSFLPSDAVYKTYYSSSRAHPKTVLQHVLLNRNPSMTRVIYEDGMGTYTGRSHTLNATRLKSTAEKILGWKLDIPENTSMMAYIPELVDVPEYLTGHVVEKMPRLQFDKKNGEMLKNIFSVDDSKRIDNKIVIFDTLRPNPSHINEDEYEILDECYRTISDYFTGDVIIKPHPRSRAVGNYDIELYEYQEVPMEVLYTDMEDLNERILIAYTSSAVFTQKILFDKEPTVICLHRLIKNSRSSITFEPIFEKFKSIYSKQDKVCAPDSMDDLKLLLRALS